ncbi:MAG: hypothetical protein CYPHOPRED_001508 [Cyphobasidiales sp. Tagirdzhanova-0007]|nr:MAG: hypothetical protein CYPHOPRED_001508 [Cyphobasidiales sp. Tagirdzhanova-0007]
MLSTLDFTVKWPHYSPRVLTMLVWILSISMAFALAVMSIWQLWLIASNETSVEANDNAYYRKLAKLKHRAFLNPYDLGSRENLLLFFNLAGDHHPFWTILLPVRVPAASDGWSWRKRTDWQATRVEEWEELTDDEESASGF